MRTTTNEHEAPASVGAEKDPFADALVRAGEGRPMTAGAAFATVYAGLHAQVESIVRRIVRDHAMAEEVAQDVLFEVWRKADQFDPGRGTARAWVATLARRRAVDRVRSEQARRNRDDRVSRRDAETPRDDVAESVELRLDHWQVRRALDALTERQRTAIELAYYDGYTYRDVADVLGIPEGTAKSRLRDGLQRLRGELEGLV